MTEYIVNTLVFLFYYIFAQLLKTLVLILIELSETVSYVP